MMITCNTCMWVVVAAEYMAPMGRDGKRGDLKLGMHEG